THATRREPAFGISLEACPQECRVPFVDLLEAIHCGGRVGEPLGCNRPRTKNLLKVHYGRFHRLPYPRNTAVPGALPAGMPIASPPVCGRSLNALVTTRIGRITPTGAAA